MFRSFMLCSLILFSITAISFSQTSFSYQGLLKNGSTPVTASTSFQFRLFDALTAGVQQGSTLFYDGASGHFALIDVATGLFTINLDFGSQFSGAQRFLEITVNGVPLQPRQRITATPYAIGLILPYTAAGATGNTIPLIAATNTSSEYGILTTSINGDAVHAISSNNTALDGARGTARPAFLEITSPNNGSNVMDAQT